MFRHGQLGRRASLISTLGCAAMLLMVACSGSGTGPSVPAVGSYTLTSYDSQALPVVLRVIEGNPTTPGGESIRCEDRLGAMDLTLNAQGRFASTSERRLVCDNGDPDEVTHPAASGSYQVGGTTVTLTFDEEDGLKTVAIGTLGPTSLTIAKRITSGENGAVTDPTPLEFTRVQ